MSRVIFLDFDGVVVTLADQERLGAGKLDPEKVALVDRLCQTCDAHVVVSSAWRSTVSDMRVLLHKAGLTNVCRRVVGITPRLPDRERGDEIAAYLTAHPEVKSFAIVDDDNDMGTLASYLVRTVSDVGLTHAHVPMLARLLSTPNRRAP